MTIGVISRSWLLWKVAFLVIVHRGWFNCSDLGNRGVYERGTPSRFEGCGMKDQGKCRADLCCAEL
jgi:hypothetical protein